MKLEDLLAKFIKLKWDIKSVISESSFGAYEDLSGIEDWDASTDDPDKLQLLKESVSILNKLSDVYCTIEYLSLPIKDTGYLKQKSNGRYELNGHEFTSGCGIEYYCTDDEQYYDYDDDRCLPYWAASRIEHNGSNYYIVGCKKDITEVQVRYRSR